MTSVHPLTFVPVLKPKVWGGDRLAALGKATPQGGAMGESWELADLPESVAGPEGRSLIASGDLAGRPLRDAVELWGRDLLGGVSATPEGDFPLLVKFLDAREHLSVQVHPSASYAAAHPDAHLKTECWRVIDAEPGAELFIGFEDGVDAAEVRQRAQDGTLPEVMRRWPAIAGETHLLVSGTCHALGAGVLVAEVQTPSDTTFRLYDWTREYDRPEREMHIEQAVECLEFGASHAPTSLGDDENEGRTVTTDTFVVDEVRMSCEERPVGQQDGDGPVVITVLETMGASLRVDGSAGEQPSETELRTGSTVLVPASVVERSVLAAGPRTRLLKTTLV